MQLFLNVEEGLTMNAIWTVLAARKKTVLTAAACVMALTGCIEDGLDIEDDTTTSLGGSFFPQSRVATGCPSSCTNIDLNTATSIPSSCQAACPNTQTASQCVAAGAAYDLYVKNGEQGASAADVATLYSQYQEQAQLTREFYSTFGCN